jgi:hypothetical protein
MNKAIRGGPARRSVPKEQMTVGMREAEAATKKNLAHSHRNQRGVHLTAWKRVQWE